MKGHPARNTIASRCENGEENDIVDDDGNKNDNGNDNDEQALHWIGLFG